MLNDECLTLYGDNGSSLSEHTERNQESGIEITAGSLGHGFNIAIGIALADKINGRMRNVYTLLGDGECQEGSIWEGIMFAAPKKITNIIMIVDRNGLQGLGRTKEILTQELLDKRFESFGWSVKMINGHDFVDIQEAFTRLPFNDGKPSVIIANTIKGKGVSFMEDRLEWHYKDPNFEQTKQALNELEASL